MTVMLRLKPDVEVRLQARAAAAGAEPADYLESLIEEALPPLPLEEAITLYDRRLVSQGQAAALAGVSRSEFIDALGRAGVSVFQYTAEEAIEEALREEDRLGR